MTQNIVSAFKRKSYHTLLFLTYQAYQFLNTLFNLWLLLVIIVICQIFLTTVANARSDVKRLLVKAKLQRLLVM